MKTNKEYKNEALAALKGKWAPAIVATIVAFVVAVIAITPSQIMSIMAENTALDTEQAYVILALWPVSMILMTFLYSPTMTVGYQNAIRSLVIQGDENVTSNLFAHTFKGYWKNVWACFLMVLFIFLWSLLLLIPGIVKGYAYMMTPFILKDNPELSANEAINLSQKMMKGHKFDLFYLMLSFIGWAFLGIFTLGIGYLWLMPYTYAAFAAFYQDLKKEYLTNNI